MSKVTHDRYSAAQCHACRAEDAAFQSYAMETRHTVQTNADKGCRKPDVFARTHQRNAKLRAIAHCVFRLWKPFSGAQPQ
ncbi:hypothetical protein [Providencia rettgeri]|uniref:hypothetical protein n=1 Tax=Providencia rettgeri TaxID=587 RepID=UPI0013DAE907|nr:hypothetical protein [Providencia rettgeri]